MLIKNFFGVLSIFLLCLVNTVFATPHSANLYVKFKEKPYKQKIYIDVRDGNYRHTISCSTQITHSKLKNNGPSCGFGFKNQTIVISQIKYSSLGNQLKVCPELNGTQFTHGILYLSPKSGINNFHCTFKKTKTNMYLKK